MSEVAESPGGALVTIEDRICATVEAQLANTFAVQARAVLYPLVELLDETGFVCNAQVALPLSETEVTRRPDGLLQIDLNTLVEALTRTYIRLHLREAKDRAVSEFVARVQNLAVDQETQR